MAGITIYEFDALVTAGLDTSDVSGVHSVPSHIFAWLELQALGSAEQGKPSWIKLSQRRGRRALVVTSFVGVIRAPDGYQIEVLPKVAKAIGGGDVEARQLLIEMLRCLGGFRHIQTQHAELMATKMPLLEVFIGEFLRSVEHLLKRGLRSSYQTVEDNLSALRGKLQIAAHLRRNICRRDRFYVAHDEFSSNRPENRLLVSALRSTLDWTSAQENQRLARELCFAFADIPSSAQPSSDFQRVQLDRGMAHYDEPLAWARLILDHESPLTGAADHAAPSLLFPMEAVFEAFVAKHLGRQLSGEFILRAQVRSLSLVRHQQQDWFRLKPDLLVQESKINRLVLDTKWKLLHESQATGSSKYGIDQADFYQLFAYGHNYFSGGGDLVLIYPKTHKFNKALDVFEFPKSKGMRLWVLPFSLSDKKLVLPSCGSLDNYFR